MKTNNEVIKSFLSWPTQDDFVECVGSSLKQRGDRLISYQTAIAVWTVTRGVAVTTNRYSKATKTHIETLKGALAESGFRPTNDILATDPGGRDEGHLVDFVTWRKNEVAS